MILEIAIGDAFGAAYEYANKKTVSIHGYRSHPKHLNPSGCYTDDTQMSIGIIELLLEEKDWTKELIGTKFFNCFKRDDRKGYARRFYEFLSTTENATDFINNIKPDSDKSGAAMRSVPMGLIKDIDELIHKSQLQASFTHNTTDGILAAHITALSSHFFIYEKGNKTDLISFLTKYLNLNGNNLINWNKPVGSKGLDSVGAAITAIMKHNNFCDILKTCINFTGDVDTVAAIALGIASTSKQFVNNLPFYLFTGLENNNYGRDFLIDMDEKLFKHFKLSVPKHNFSI
jgi:ADP-ribosylglycohydrolase